MSDVAPQGAALKRGALVLCGGRSTRMGRDKATLPFGNEVLLQRVVRLLGEVVDDIVVVGRGAQEYPQLPENVRIVHDEVEDKGPLGGLATGLKATRADAVYVTGCDVPFMKTAVVDLLFERLGDNEIAVTEAEGFLHPLTAVYRVGVLPIVERLLAKDRLRPAYLFDQVPTERVHEEDIYPVDPGLNTLNNLNTKRAYESALTMLRAEPTT